MSFRTKLMQGSFHINEPCKLCNQWILNDEDYYIVYIPSEIYTKYGIRFFMAHKDEWDNFSEGLSDDEIAQKLLKHKKAKRKPHTKQQLKNTEAFKEACSCFGFDKFTTSRDKRFVKTRKEKKSFTLIYDIVFDKVSYETRTREQMLEKLCRNEFVATVYNKMHEIREDNKRNEFSK